MKRLFLSMTLAISSIALFAQQDLTITEGEGQMSQGIRSSYSVTIPQTKAKTVTEDLKKYIKTGSKNKVTDTNGEIAILGAVNTNISSLPFNVFAKVTETSNGILTTWWLSEGETFWSTASLAAAKGEAVKKYIHDFVVQEYQNAVKDELKTEQDKAKEAQKVLDGYVKDQKKAESAIMDHKAEIANREKKIKEEEANIQTAVANQQKQQAAVAAQQAVVSTVQQKLGNIR